MKKRQVGFTVLELCIALGLVALIAIAASEFLLVNRGATASSMSLGSLDATLNRLLEQLAGELLEGGIPTLDPVEPAGGSSLAFRRPADYVDGEVQWGPLVRVEFREVAGEGTIVRVENPGASDERVLTLTRGVAPYGDGETANGLDDDGDGLVDERGLWFRRAGRVITIGLTLEAPDGQGGRTTRSATTKVRLRNG